MKNVFLKYLEHLKVKHFFLLLAVITSFLYAIIQAFIVSLTGILDSFLSGIAIFMSPFILVCIISFFASICHPKIKFLVSLITFLLNGFIIVAVQCLFGTFSIIFGLCF